MQKTSELIWQDAQHQVLFELIDLLKSPDTGSEIFVRLAHYAENHFHLEEIYMEQLDYPNTKEHVAAHDRFREELGDMIHQSIGFDEQVRASISRFLTEWLTRHILGIDRELEAFILASDVK